MGIEILPDELIFEILVLLPIATLVRSRCVSKTWCNLIDSPKFVKFHFDRSNKEVIFFGRPNAHQIGFDSVCNSTSDNVVSEELTNPCHGIISDCYGVLGPFNGLFCVFSHSGDFCVWNPYTKKHFHVSKIPVDLQNDFLMASWGFGYDSSSDDYKVVCIAVPKNSATKVLWLYSLKSGSWLSIGEFPYFFLDAPQRGAFINGALHWAARNRSKPSESIVAFDLEKLEYSFVPQLESMPTEGRMRVGVFDGCLYAIYQFMDTNVGNSFGTNTFDLWVMKEYGVKESWTRLIACTFSIPTSLTPLAYTKAGDLLLATSAGFSHDGFSRGILRYEFETRSFNKIEETFKQEFSSWFPDLRCPLVYTPTLVCPQSAENLGVAL